MPQGGTLSDCRLVQFQSAGSNRGIDEIRKYYRTRLDIIFQKGGMPDKYLDEMFERRHILVHRLGKTDARYRSEFSTSSARVSVDEAYLLNALRTIDTLTAFVHSEVKELVKSSKQAGIKAAFHTVRLELADISPGALPYLQPDHPIASGTGSVPLGDILLTYLGDKRERSLILSGSKSIINSFIASLRDLEQRKELVIVHKVLIEPGQKCNLSVSVMQEITKRLGSGPIHRDQHKTIASELGLSNKQTYAAIAIIEANPTKYTGR